MTTELKKRRGSLLPSGNKEKKKDSDLVVKANPIFGTGAQQQHGTLKTNRGNNAEHAATISASGIRKSGSEFVSLLNPPEEPKSRHTLVEESLVCVSNWFWF